MKCLDSNPMVSTMHSLETERLAIPWVTKLPKLRPTMQCQVAPFLASNYGLLTSGSVHRWSHTNLLLNVLRNVLSSGAIRTNVGRPMDGTLGYLFNVVSRHCLRCYCGATLVRPRNDVGHRAYQPRQPPAAIPQTRFAVSVVGLRKGHLSGAPHHIRGLYLD